MIEIGQIDSHQGAASAGPMSQPHPAPLQEAPPDTLGTPTCVHHWVLGEPSRAGTKGTCRRCGIERLFSSTPEGVDRFDDFRELTQSRAYWAARGPSRDADAA